MALDSYRTAIARARPDETIDGISLAGAARDHLFRMLVRQAVRLRGERRWESAVRQLESAAGYARTDAERLESRLLLADIQLDAGRLVRRSRRSSRCCSIPACGLSPSRRTTAGGRSGPT